MITTTKPPSETGVCSENSHLMRVGGVQDFHSCFLTAVLPALTLCPRKMALVALLSHQEPRDHSEISICLSKELS